MHEEKYSYSTNEDLLNYEFDSIGPKGTIKKSYVLRPEMQMEQRILIYKKVSK
jgi:hypothetical protein